MSEALGFAQDQFGRAGKSGFIGAVAAQIGLGLGIPPRLVGDAAQRKTGFLDRVAIELKPSRDGHECEGIRQPVADLDVSMMRCKSLRRQLDRDHQFVDTQIGVALRRVAWKPVKVR